VEFCADVGTYSDLPLLGLCGLCGLCGRIHDLGMDDEARTCVRRAGVAEWSCRHLVGITAGMSPVTSSGKNRVHRGAADSALLAGSQPLPLHCCVALRGKRGLTCGLAHYAGAKLGHFWRFTWRFTRCELSAILAPNWAVAISADQQRIVTRRTSLTSLGLHRGNQPAVLHQVGNGSLDVAAANPEQLPVMLAAGLHAIGNDQPEIVRRDIVGPFEERPVDVLVTRGEI
jgi:hypothetical protein